MITLFGFGPSMGLPETSPYVTKTEVQLKMAGLEYRKDTTTTFSRAPKGKLPYIEDDGQLIADSTFIRGYIQKKYGVDLDAGLSVRQRGEAWAVERMVEDHLGWVAMYAFWLMPENFAKGPAHFFDGAPEAVRAKLREDALARVTAAVHAHGIGRHNEDEIFRLGSLSLLALSEILDDRPFITGDKPCGADATVFAFTSRIVGPFIDSPLRQAALKHTNLVDYAGRMMRTYYPEHPWSAEEALAA